jgi:hypothetical protein
VLEVLAPSPVPVLLRFRGLPIASFSEPLRSLELLDGAARDVPEAAAHEEEDAAAVLEVLAPSLVLVLLRFRGLPIASFTESLRSLELLDGAARDVPEAAAHEEEDAEAMLEDEEEDEEYAAVDVGRRLSHSPLCSSFPGPLRCLELLGRRVAAPEEELEEEEEGEEVEEEVVARGRRVSHSPPCSFPEPVRTLGLSGREATPTLLMFEEVARALLLGRDPSPTDLFSKPPRPSELLGGGAAWAVAACEVPMGARTSFPPPTFIFPSSFTKLKR